MPPITTRLKLELSLHRSPLESGNGVRIVRDRTGVWWENFHHCSWWPWDAPWRPGRPRVNLRWLWQNCHQWIPVALGCTLHWDNSGEILGSQFYLDGCHNHSLISSGSGKCPSSSILLNSREAASCGTSTREQREIPSRITATPRSIP